MGPDTPSVMALCAFRAISAPFPPPQGRTEGGCHKDIPQALRWSAHPGLGPLRKDGQPRPISNPEAQSRSSSTLVFAASVQVWAHPGQGDSYT